MFAVLGATAVQRGPLWWAAHHRRHHAHSDRPGDAHSARQDGFLWSHMGWFLARENFATRMHLVRDLARFPELRWLDRYDVAVPAALFGALWALGAWLEAAHPALGTGPWQLVVWGFCISTVVLFHATFVINSLAHRWGTRRYETSDDSRNNLLLALITFGEGWHNNHHRYPGAVRQGFYWWEVDLSFYALKALAALGIVRDLRPVPRSVLEAGAAAPRGIAREDRDRRRRHRRQRRGARAASRPRRHRVRGRASTSAATATRTTIEAARAHAGTSTPASSSSTTAPTRTSSRCSTSWASPRRRAA